MKIILVTGVRRTGSTWQYNVIRLALIEAGYSVHGSGEYDSKINVDYYVIHIHGYDYELRKRAFKIFTTVRRFEGVKESLKRMGWYKSDKVIMKYISEWRMWWRYACHITNFSELISDELDQIIGILISLDIDWVDEEIVQKKLHKLKTPKKGRYKKTGGYHTTTLLHPHHYE